MDQGLGCSWGWRWVRDRAKEGSLLEIELALRLGAVLGPGLRVLLEQNRGWCWGWRRVWGWGRVKVELGDMGKALDCELWWRSWAVIRLGLGLRLGLTMQAGG